MTPGTGTLDYREYNIIHFLVVPIHSNFLSSAINSCILVAYCLCGGSVNVYQRIVETPGYVLNANSCLLPNCSIIYMLLVFYSQNKLYMWSIFLILFFLLLICQMSFGMKNYYHLFMPYVKSSNALPKIISPELARVMR